MRGLPPAVSPDQPMAQAGFQYEQEEFVNNSSIANTAY